MEIEASFYDEKLYIRTTTDNIISRSATILKPQSLDIPMVVVTPFSFSLSVCSLTITFSFFVIREGSLLEIM